MTDLTSIGGGLAISWSSSAVNTFKNCKSLTSVRLPASVGAIGANAFEGCTNLETINLDNIAVFGKQAFSGCGLKSLTLPVISVTGYSSSSSAYTNMGENVFEKNTQLTTLVIPEGVNALYKNAFAGCTALQEVTFPESFRMSDVVTTTNAYSGYSGMFSGCTALKKVTFKAPELAAIPSSMFSGCSVLDTVELNDVVVIKGSAFSGTALTSFTIGASTQTVDASVFANIETLTKVTIESESVAIGKEAFKDSGLAEIIFPENTSGISFADNAFDGCKFKSFEVPNAASIGKYFLANNAELTNVTFATGFALETLPAHFFDGCTSLTKIDLPSSVKGLDAYALANTGLVTYEVPKEITTMGEGALANNEKLTTVTFEVGSTIEKFGSKVFFQDRALESVTLPDSLKETGTYCFQYCEALESITLPEGFTTFGMYSFANCTNLATVNFNGNTTIKGIGAHVFEYCTSLTQITLPTSLEYTGQYTFQYSGLTSIDLSGYTSMKYLGSTSATSAPTSTSGHVFYMCENLAEVKLPAQLTHIAAYCFSGCTSLTDIEIPSTVTFIGKEAFSGSGLTSIDLSGTSMKYIGQGSGTSAPTVSNAYALTFKDCVDLAEVKLPSTATHIGPNTFAGCKSLTSIELPASLTFIGNNAFDGTGLTHIELPATLATLGGNVFKDCTALKLVYIPKDMKVAKTTSGFAATVFAGCKDFTIYTDGKAEDVKKNWSALSSLNVVGETSLDEYKALEAYKELLPKTEEAEEPEEGTEEGIEG